MLEHITGTELIGVEAARAAMWVDTESGGLPSTARERIEDYLEQVCSPLVKYMAYAERKERRREMQTHLESLTQAHVELGSTAGEAVTLALQQFGSPRKVTRRWLREWEQTYLVVPTRSARPATRWALPRFALIALAISGILSGTGVLECSGDLPPAVAHTLFLIELGLLFGLPLLAGFRTGLTARSRPVLGTLYAQAVTLPLIPVTLELMATLFGFPSHVDGLPLMAAGTFAFLAPMGCVGALCGSHLRRRRRPVGTAR